LASLKTLVVVPNTSAISKASGGIGKNDDSVKARINSAVVLCGVFNQ